MVQRLTFLQICRGKLLLDLPRLVVNYFWLTATRVYILNNPFQMIKAQLEQPSEGVDLLTRQAQEMVLEFELKKLLLYGPGLGIYVMAGLDIGYICNGIMFVRHGYYKEAKFKFTINFEQFPEKQPSIAFMTRIYHPLVDLKTGHLDVAATLQEPWRYGNQAMLYRLMNNLHRIFNCSEYLSERGSFNPEAAKTFDENVQKFTFQAMDSVDESLDYFYGERIPVVTSTSISTSLSVDEIPENENEVLREQLFQVCADGTLTTEQKITSFIKTILE